MSPDPGRISNVCQVSDSVQVVQATEFRPTQKLSLYDMVKGVEREAASCAGRKGGGDGSGSARGGWAFDVRLNLRGKRGGCLALELSSEVLCENSPVFADLIADCCAEPDGSGAKLCRIEVPEVENLGVFRDTIELMFEDDLTRRLLRMGTYRAIDLLQIKHEQGLRYTTMLSSQNQRARAKSQRMKRSCCAWSDSWESIKGC